MPDEQLARDEPTAALRRLAQALALKKTAPGSEKAFLIPPSRTKPRVQTRGKIPAATPAEAAPVAPPSFAVSTGPAKRQAKDLKGQLDDPIQSPQPIKQPPGLDKESTPVQPDANSTPDPKAAADEVFPSATPGAAAVEEPVASGGPKSPGEAGAMEIVVAAEVLRRVTRSRQVVSLVSQVIIRSYEEEALLAEACRHLVAYGGYLMAWIGIADDTPERVVRPVAHAGLDANFLQALKITWASDLANRSPTSRAILEQRPYVARNILKEPRYAVLRDEAQLRGYTATCALPMQYGQYGNGVLTIHAAEPDAFGAEEVSLVRELANDVAAGVIGLRDRARRQALEDDAMRLQERFASIVDNAREGIFQSTLDGKLILVNNALVRLLGYNSKEELLAVLPPVLLTHLHPDYAKTALTGMFVEDGAQPFEARMRKKAGGWLWVDIVAKRVEGPDGPIIEGFVQDTTAGHGEALASARLAAVVDAADDAIIGTDLDGKITDWNAGATRLFGYERAEAVGHLIAETIVPPERLEESIRAQADIARGERVPRFETLRLCKEGKVIPVSIMITPIFGVDGNIMGSTSVQHDIADERAAEKARTDLELEEAEMSRLEHLERVRKTFISEASHELNTPLTPLLIHVEALGEDANLTPQQRSHVVVIERNVLRLANLVKDMLEASRLETGRFKLELADVLLAGLVESAIQNLAESANAAGVALEPGFVARLTTVGDRNRVGQVLYNFVSNAINFTPRGGRITISAKLEDGQAVVRVKDTGIGLSAPQIASLFQPFSRPHEGVGSGPKGTGLGLYISKGIIEQHGGRIWAESKGPGTGSSFCFSLPLAPPPRT